MSDKDFWDSIPVVETPPELEHLYRENTWLEKIVWKTKWHIKMWWQRRTRGFDDTELWDLDDTIARFVLPRLKAFRNYTKGYPQDFSSFEEWQAAIDKMIRAHEIKILEQEMFIDDNEKLVKEMKEGYNLYFEYHSHLWD